MNLTRTMEAYSPQNKLKNIEKDLKNYQNLYQNNKLFIKNSLA